MANLFAKISGLKTYITLALGVIILVIGHFWGPLTIGPVDVPFVDTKTMWEGIWFALTGIFLRQGVTKSGPPK